MKGKSQRQNEFLWQKEKLRFAPFETKIYSYVVLLLVRAIGVGLNVLR